MDARRDPCLCDPLSNYVGFESKSELESSAPPTQILLDLMSDANLIRNVAFVGNSSPDFMSMLVEQSCRTPILYGRNEIYGRNEMQFRDVRFTGKIKAIPVSLILEDGNSNLYLCNFMDTPTHGDFADEIVAALRLADGAVLVVDAVKGVMMNTRRVIKLVIAERLPMVVVINKVDNLIRKLELSPEEAYSRLRCIIEDVNSQIMISFSDDDGDVMKIDPRMGNVCFASDTIGWSFTLQSFVKNYVQRNRPDMFQEEDGKKVDNCIPFLWGDHCYDPDTRVVFEGEKTGGVNPFIHYVLQPLYRIYDQVVRENKERTVSMLAELGVTLSDDSYRLNFKSVIRLVCGLVFGSISSFTDMLVNHIPSARDAASIKVKHIYTGPSDSFICKSMENCDPSGPLMVNVTKLYPRFNWSVFTALGRVYSGEICTGQNVLVLGERYSPDDKEDMTVKEVTNLWVKQAHRRIPIAKAPPGTWVLIEGVDESIEATATICHVDYSEDVYVFRTLEFDCPPIVQLPIDPIEPEQLARMVEALGNISKSFPQAIVAVEEFGQHIILGTGKIYLRAIVNDISQHKTDLEGHRLEVKVGSYAVSLLETVVEKSIIDCNVQTINKMNKISMVAEPLVEVPDGSDNLSSLLQTECGSDLHGRPIWAIVPDKQVPTILVDDRSSREDDTVLNSVKHSIVRGFQLGAREGPLCDEPIRNVQFKIVDARIALEPVHRKSSQIIKAARLATRSSLLMGSARLMEPEYLVEIHIESKDVSAVKELLSQSRGHVTSESLQIGGRSSILGATLPVMESFDFGEKLKETNCRSSFQWMFGRWVIVPGDPVVPTADQHLAHDFMVKTRLRKGIVRDVMDGHEPDDVDPAMDMLLHVMEDR